MKRHGTLDLQPRSQLRKLTVCKNILYFIHTQIFIVKHYRSRLWLDEQCILTAVRFQSLNWNVKKNLGLYEVKTSYHGKRLNDFYSLIAMHQKTHFFAALNRWFFLFFFLFFVFVFCFFLMYRNSWIRIIRAHFPWDNLFPRRQVRL